MHLIAIWKLILSCARLVKKYRRNLLSSPRGLCFGKLNSLPCNCAHTTTNYIGMIKEDTRRHPLYHWHAVLRPLFGSIFLRNAARAATTPPYSGSRSCVRPVQFPVRRLGGSWDRKVREGSRKPDNYRQIRGH